MAGASKSAGVKAPIKTIKKPEGSPVCYGKYVFAGAVKCRSCNYHVDCKKVK
jgi:hypothetical protein